MADRVSTITAGVAYIGILLILTDMDPVVGSILVLTGVATFIGNVIINRGKRDTAWTN